ncbi:MAG: DUF1361 domain-containing protein [Anaerolineales bacterium]|nr:DUF1361 domain-containing protein [Anaerolineales bacterium]
MENAASPDAPAASAPAAKPEVGRFSCLHQGLLVFTMVVCSGVSVLLWFIRAAKSDSTVYASLNFNLFLAWIPAVFALIAYNAYRKGSCVGAVVALGCAAIWLLFFPNAPYLITDLVHLRPREEEMPYWFDQILYMAFSFAGCYLGMVSLILMQGIVKRALGTVLSWLFALAAIVAAGFGIYIGRFLRFNSWDLLVNPKPLLKEILDWIRHPRSNSDAFIFSLTFSLFFTAIYFVVVAILNLRRAERKE